MRPGEEIIAQHLATYFRGKYPDLPVRHGEVESTDGASDIINWRADVVVGASVPYELCVECKSGFEYRKGVGQAIGYTVHNHAAGLACRDPPEAVREMVAKSPIHGWAVSENGIEHYSTDEI